MAKLRLIDRWAAFTDEELLALEGALDHVEAHTPVDCPPVAAESLSDEIGAEIRQGVAEALPGELVARSMMIDVHGGVALCEAFCVRTGLRDSGPSA